MRRLVPIAILAALLAVVCAEGGPVGMQELIVEGMRQMQDDRAFEVADASNSGPLTDAVFGGPRGQLEVTREATYERGLRYQRAIGD